jgi:hypothetical protein
MSEDLSYNKCKDSISQLGHNEDFQMPERRSPVTVDLRKRLFNRRAPSYLPRQRLLDAPEWSLRAAF